MQDPCLLKRNMGHTIHILNLSFPLNDTLWREQAISLHSFPWPFNGCIVFQPLPMAIETVPSFSWFFNCYKIMFQWTSILGYIFSVLFTKMFCFSFFTLFLFPDIKLNAHCRKLGRCPPKSTKNKTKVVWSPRRWTQAIPPSPVGTHAGDQGTSITVLDCVKCRHVWARYVNVLLAHTAILVQGEAHIQGAMWLAGRRDGR